MGSGVRQSQGLLRGGDFCLIPQGPRGGQHVKVGRKRGGARGLWLKGNTGRGQKPEKGDRECQSPDSSKQQQNTRPHQLKQGLVCSRKTLTLFYSAEI